MDESKKMLEIAYKALEDKKGENILALDITGISIVADYFLITNGNSDAQNRALMEAAEEALEKAGYTPKQIEGNHHGDWVLMDYGDIIIHIFTKESRDFFDLARIWSDGKRVEL